MDRWALVALALGLACVVALAGVARAQADREGGPWPQMGDGPMLEMVGPGGMEPGGPPVDDFGSMMGMRGPGGPGGPMGGQPMAMGAPAS